MRQIARPSAATAPSTRNAALEPAPTTTNPAGIVDSAAPMLWAVMTAPCATFRKRAARVPDRQDQSFTASTTAPAPIMAMPIQPCALGRSPRKAKANSATSTTLSLSIGATSVAGPSFSARK
jgi:hypothetical protein